MKLNYKNLLLSTATAIMLTACGGGGSERGSTPEPTPTPNTQTKLAKAQLGALSGATVEIHELGVTPYKLLFTETTSAGDSVEKTGNFDSHYDSLEADKFYLYTVSNGLDIDANDDGEIDAIPTVNNGSFHAIVQGKSVKKVKGDFKVTTASELLYKKVKADINETEKLEEKLISSSKEIFKQGIDDDGEVTNDDILQYNPVDHKEVFKEAYKEKLLEIIKDIHDDKKELEKLSPTANAGGDRSIIMGESILLKSLGFDMDGSIISYTWSEDGKDISNEQSFTYKPNILGTHTLTLMVTDNDGLSAIDRVRITVLENQNTAPVAKTANYTLDEDNNIDITLEGSDTDSDALTYKIVVNPIYGILSGTAPNLIYTPNANFNGEDRFIFVTNDGKADSQRTEIKLTVQKVNNKPILNPLEIIQIDEDGRKKFYLNEKGSNGDTITYTISSTPTFGKLTHQGAIFTYIPNVNYTGSDSFKIRSDEGQNGLLDVSIRIKINPINDAPTVDAGGDKSTTVGSTITLTATANDVDGEIKSYRWFENETELSQTYTTSYTPTTMGTHILSVMVTDDKGLTSVDRVNITVSDKPNTPPVVTAQSITMEEDTTKDIILTGSDEDNDTLVYTIQTQPRHGKLTGQAPNFTYVPNKDYFGNDSFTFKANDGKDDSAMQTVSIMISDVEEPDVTKPVITLNGYGILLLDLGNTYTELGATATDDRDGTLTVSTSGSVDSSKVGTYTITYTATDDAGNIATKKRTIKVKVLKPFITTWKTDNSGGSEDNQLSIEAPKSNYSYRTKKTRYFTYNFNIDWGDGTTDSGVSETITHTYATAGTYTVKISGKFPWFQTNGKFPWYRTRDSMKLLSVEQWGTNVWEYFGKSFKGCKNFVLNATDTPDLSRVTSMDHMFADAEKFNSPLNHWDVSNVTNMSGMFVSAEVFNQPLDNWDVSNVTDMHYMFLYAYIFNQPLNNWNVSKVTNMKAMFKRTKAFNQPLNNWDVSNVTNMNEMFEEAEAFNQPLNNWDVSNVTNMSSMFANGSIFNYPLDNWDVSNVTDMSCMFGDDGYYLGKNINVFNQPLNNWDVSNVTNMEDMFANAKSFNQSLDNWNVSNVTNMMDMFSKAKSFNQPLNNWDVSNVTNMRRMFKGAEVFNQPIGNWDVSSVEPEIEYNYSGMHEMFKGAKSFNQDITTWDVSKNTNYLSYNIFSGAENFDTSSIKNWFDSRIIGYVGGFPNYYYSYKSNSILSSDESRMFVYGKGIHVLNIQNKSKPQLLTTINIENNGKIKDIALSVDEKTLYVVDVANTDDIIMFGRRYSNDTKGLRIIDISDINNPIQKGFLHLNDATKVILSPSKNIVYIANSLNVLSVDISNSSNPQIISDVDFGTINDMAMSADENSLYVTNSHSVRVYNGPSYDESRIYKWDISDRTQIVKDSAHYIVKTSIEEFDLSADEKNIFIKTHRGLIIIDNPMDHNTNELSKMQELKDIFISSATTSQDGEKLYLMAGNKLMIYNSSNMSNPILLDSMHLGMKGAIKLSADENSIYISNSGAVAIVDVSGN